MPDIIPRFQKGICPKMRTDIKGDELCPNTWKAGCWFRKSKVYLILIHAHEVWSVTCVIGLFPPEHLKFYINGSLFFLFIQRSVCNINVVVVHLQ